MGVLSQWLQIMLAEIARKRDELQQGKEEERRRELTRGSTPVSASESAESDRISEQPDDRG